MVTEEQCSGDLTTVDDINNYMFLIYSGRNIIISGGLASNEKPAFSNYAPWIPLGTIQGTYGSYTLIQRETAFQVVMAVEPSALRSAKKINVKLVN